MSFEIFAFTDKHHNTIKYLFNASKRESDGEGPVVLDQLIETYDPSYPSSSPSLHTPTEPKPGTLLFEYPSRDGGLVRYMYDPTARNGKQYVVAVHREPQNWQRLKEEDLGVADEEALWRMFDGRDLNGGGQEEERKGVFDAEEESRLGEKQERRGWVRDRYSGVEEDVRRSKRRDSLVDEGMGMDVDV